MSTITINDALVELDKVIDATNYLLEELKTRKEQLLAPGNLSEAVKNAMDNDDFRSTIAYYVRNSFSGGLSRQVAFNIMEEIDSDIEAFINSRVEAALQKAIKS